MAHYVGATAITSTYYSACKYEIEGFYSDVSRSGNNVSFSFGIRLRRTSGSYTTNAITIRYGNSASGTMKRIQGSGTSNLLTQNTWYYAADSNKTTTETYSWSYSGSPGTGAGTVAITVGWNDTLGNPGAGSSGYVAYTFYVPYGASFTYPYWTKYVVNSFPATAYSNIPYSYNIDLACNYGSSTSQNLLYWEGYSGDHGVTMVSTTGTSIGAGARTYTFNNNDIGSYNFRGVIRYNDGSTKYNVHGTTYPLTVSFLNPTITGVSNILNATSFYRTSTVQSTSSATITGNSASPTVYTYFSSPDAPGDGSGTGFYKIGSYDAAKTSTFSGVTKSYTHPGNKPGTFYARLSMRANNAAGSWTEFATAGQVSYTMQQFVAPTMTRTITYQKHNVYVGQTKLPVSTVVTAVSKSQYDTLTPSCSVLPLKNGTAISNVSSAHNWANGTYNATLTVPACVSGDTISFRDQMVYKDALNADAYDNVNSTSYVVKTIPQPNIAEISIMVSSNEIKKQITAGVTGNFDSDFVGQYTLYLENASGTTVYAQTSGTVGYDDYVEHIFTYNGSVSENYKIRMVSNFALSDETSVKGTSTTTYSGTIRVIGGTKIYIKHDGENYDKLLPVDADECPKPRLAFKYGDTIKYVPLYTDTPSAGTKQLWVRQGGTSYYTLLNTQFGSLYPSDDLYPEGNELSYEDLTAFTHQFLSSYTHQQIHDGDIE